MRPAGEAPRPGIPRWLDAGTALLGLILSVPLLAAGAAAIVLSTGEPPLFCQRRLGRGGRGFTLVKLRTMRRRSRGPEVTAAGDARVTRIGRFLRRTKIDELPQLWNVLIGDMSLVGPRPEVPRLADLGDPRWRIVLRARPGLTDPVTLRLRDEEALLAAAGDGPGFYRDHLQPFKLRGYERYLAGRTWKSDLRILKDTIRAVISPKSVSPPSMHEILAEGLHCGSRG